MLLWTFRGFMQIAEINLNCVDICMFTAMIAA